MNGVALVGVGMLTAVPYMFQFLAYTGLVATWASIYHFAMNNQGANPFSKLRVPFVIANACLAALIFGLFASIGGAHDASEAKRIAVAATALMAILTITMIIFYVVYGSKLIGTLKDMGESSESPVVKSLYYATCAFCFCFGLEAILWLVILSSHCDCFSS